MPRPFATQPATKWFGPSKPFAPLPPDSRVLVQLFNIEPGEFWKPAKEAELLTPITLLPQFNPKLWFQFTTFFVFRFHYRQFRDVAGTRVRDHRIELTVRERVGIAPIAFQFDPDFARTEWMVNNNTDPAGVYGINGTAVLSFKGYP